MKRWPSGPKLIPQPLLGNLITDGRVHRFRNEISPELLKRLARDAEEDGRASATDTVAVPIAAMVDDHENIEKAGCGIGFWFGREQVGADDNAGEKAGSVLDDGSLARL